MIKNVPLLASYMSVFCIRRIKADIPRNQTKPNQIITRFSFSLVWTHGISTLLDYLMPNPLIYMSSSSCHAAIKDFPDSLPPSSSSSSSCRAASTVISDPLSPLLPLASLQGYIPYPHIAAECMFELVALLLPGHMRESIGVHHLWARSCFSSNVLHVWFV